MKIPIFAVMLLVVACRATTIGQGKHGFATYTPQQQSYSNQQAVALGYTKVQQQPLTLQKTATVPQLQYYTQQPTAVKYVNAPAQQQYEPQQFAYTPQAAKVAAAPVVSKVPQYSLANDVSSFAYSSPVVSYNNLGLLTQIAGKSAGGTSKSTYSASSSTGPVQPAPVTYQAPAQKFAFSGGGLAKVPQYVPQAAAAPQQQYQQYQPVQPQYVSAAQYSAPPQTYTISQPSSHYAQNQDDGQYTQSQAYSQSAAQPQYYTVPQTKYATNPGASYSQ